MSSQNKAAVIDFNRMTKEDWMLMSTWLTVLKEATREGIAIGIKAAIKYELKRADTEEGK